VNAYIGRYNANTRLSFAFAMFRGKIDNQTNAIFLLLHFLRQIEFFDDDKRQ
jgi:hypothetical protein